MKGREEEKEKKQENFFQQIPPILEGDQRERKASTAKGNRGKNSDGRFGKVGVSGGQRSFLNQSPPLPPKRKISPQEEQKEQ